MCARQGAMACIKAEELRQIVELQVKRLARRLADKKIGLELDGAALDWLATVGYDPGPIRSVSQ